MRPTMTRARDYRTVVDVSGDVSNIINQAVCAHGAQWQSVSARRLLSPASDVRFRPGFHARDSMYASPQSGSAARYGA